MLSQCLENAKNQVDGESKHSDETMQRKTANMFSRGVEKLMVSKSAQTTRLSSAGKVTPRLRIAINPL